MVKRAGDDGFTMGEACREFLAETMQGATRGEVEESAMDFLIGASRMVVEIRRVALLEGMDEAMALLGRLYVEANGYCQEYQRSGSMTGFFR